MTRRITLLVCVALIWTASVGLTQDSARESTRLLDEVSGLNHSLERLVTLVDTLVAQQETDILLKRIDMKSRRLIPLEEALRAAREDLTETDADLVKVTADVDRLESTLRDHTRDGKEGMAEMFRQALLQERPRLEALETRRAQIESRVRDLEAQIARHQGDLDDLDDLLAERLGG